MASIDVLATKSRTIANQPRFINRNHLIVGHYLCAKYLSYLYFSLPAILSGGTITSASLVLFIAGDYYSYYSTGLAAYPLLEYFSSETRYSNRPAYEAVSPQAVTTGPVSVEIDVTEIVRRWVSGELINKGLVILTNDRYEYYNFGSVLNNDKTLIPLLKVQFEPFPFPIPPIIELETSLDLFPPSQAKKK